MKRKSKIQLSLQICVEKSAQEKTHKLGFSRLPGLAGGLAVWKTPCISISAIISNIKKFTVNTPHSWSCGTGRLVKFDIVNKPTRPTRALSV